MSVCSGYVQKPPPRALGTAAASRSLRASELRRGAPAREVANAAWGNLVCQGGTPAARQLQYTN